MRRVFYFFRAQLARIAGSLQRRGFDTDFDAEIETHLALLTRDFLRQGMSQEEARCAARKQLGGLTQLKNELRDGSRFRPWEAVLQDSAYVVRQLRKSPLFAVAAILTLAFGIGANSAIFTLVNQLILRLLPVKEPQQVMMLAAQGQYYGDNMGRNVLSYTMYQTIRDRNQVFSRMMCLRPVPFTVTSHVDSESLSGELVSGNYFPLLGIQAAAGRLFNANDDLRPNANPVAVLSYAYWKSRFAGNLEVIGRKLLVNNYPLTVIGIAQPGFDGLEPGLPKQLFVPVMMTPALFPDNDFRNMFDPRLRWVNVYGRLKPGLTPDRAKAALQPLFHNILDAEVLEPGFAHATPYEKQQFLKMWLDVMPGGQGNTELRRQYERPLLVLMAVTGFVLLIACANLASLLAAKAAVRRREIAVRFAMGARRGRIIQQLTTESLLLALAGGLGGIGLAIAMVKGLLSFLPEHATGYTLASTPDLRVLCFALGLSLLTGLACGLIPAIQAARPNLADTLKANALNASAGAGQVQFRKFLVAAQISLSLLLLIGASLFIRSLANLYSVKPGFEIQNRLQFTVNPIGYDQVRAHAFYSELETRLRNLPGVEAAGVADNPVLADSDWESAIQVDGLDNKPGQQPDSYINRVSPGYFKTLGIHLLAGRTFRDSDAAQSPKVIVVSESFATYYFGQQPAVGHRIGRGLDPSVPKDLEIIGVVNDIDYQDLRQAHLREVYLCASQGMLAYATVYMSVKGDARAAFAIARRLLRQIEPKTSVTGMKTLTQQLDESLITERMVASLSTGFTILAIALAVLGLYGVMAYTVTQRAREIGIRVALGALFGNVVWLVMREVILLVVMGIAVAVPLALALGRFVEAQLYGVNPADPASMVAAAALLSGIALLAGFLPARRAAAADPLQVLRYE